MLFNSPEFIFYFLPIVLFGFFIIARFNHWLGVVWITLASLFFYGWWNPRFLILLLISVTINYIIGLLINKNRNTIFLKSIMIIGIIFNLSLLAIFKYANFFITTFNCLSNYPIANFSILLPLGISFFTFTQIAFLVDVYRGIATEYNFIHYLLFVTYFPHLIAGPILHHKQMMPQFLSSQIYRINSDNIALGISLFIIGLTKKVLLADGFAMYVSPVFNAIDKGLEPSFVVAWTGALAYTFELYFDFSGYSDMAIGISQLFGIKLPINFNSPYKSLSIIEFWRRWHISLSKFLRDYLYIPLGGNRFGKISRYRNILITMLLGGLWHGANWTFVIWGGLHGVFIVINHGWRKLSQTISLPTFIFKENIYKLLTFTAVVVAWVFFRAKDFHTAFTMLKGMLNLYGFNNKLPIDFFNTFSCSVSAIFNKMPTTLYTIKKGYFLYPMLIGFIIIWLLPNSMEVFNNLEKKISPARSRLSWQPSFGWAFFIVLILSVDLIKNFGLNLPPSPFLYFQF